MFESKSSPPLDAELLARVERAFGHHAGNEGAVDLTHLKRALGLQSDYLARRVLSAFDTDGDGLVSKEEFVRGVRSLVFGTHREKLAFAFRLHDHNGDGFIDRTELYRMIALSLVEAGIAERATQSSEHLTAKLMAMADRDGDGRISLDELEAVVRRKPWLLERMTRSEAIWIAPNEDLLLRIEAPEKSRADVSGDRAPRAVVLLLWAAANFAVAAYTLWLGRAHLTADPAMKAGRVFAAILDVNAALIFVPVLRRFLTRVRRTAWGRVFPIDDAIDFHKAVGHLLWAASLVHSSAFVAAYAAGHGAAPWRLLLTSRGATGTALLIVFAILWTGALGPIRRSGRFELFYATHLLYVVWLVVAVAHAPRLLLFAGIPFAALVLEQAVRHLRRRPPARVVAATALRSGVTRLELERPAGLTFRAGDYVFLRIPAVARHEWHPFTISSAPESPHLTFHVRSLGNWTASLRELAETSSRPELRAHVDGPYGAPSEGVFRARFAVLIGAGIGVTPFASVLESLLLRANARGGAEATRHQVAAEKVHFFWLNRDQVSFEWFRELLGRLEAMDARGLLEIHLCMTGGRSGATAFGLELARDILQAEGRSDIVTGLRTRTHMGHPDWDTLLGDIAKRHAPAPVDVFFCGPHGLAKKIAAVCRRTGMAFHEERF